MLHLGICSHRRKGTDGLQTILPSLSSAIHAFPPASMGIYFPASQCCFMKLVVPITSGRRAQRTPPLTEARAKATSTQIPQTSHANFVWGPQHFSPLPPPYPPLSPHGPQICGNAANPDNSRFSEGQPRFPAAVFIHRCLAPAAGTA